MNNFFFRTEAIRPDEIKEYFVETKEDRKILEQLKGRNPILLVGSRGVGKSFLMRVAEAELLETYTDGKVLPVYLTFRKSSLIHTSDKMQFHSWMMSRMCNEILRTIQRMGLLTRPSEGISILSGQYGQLSIIEKTGMEIIAEQFEDSWKEPNVAVHSATIPTVDEFLDAIEDLCLDLNIKRIAVYFDEAAHIFIPEQQRQFFTLFRDLRSPYITCHAAIYPGVTAYGETFEPIHDATTIPILRDIQDENFISGMREIVFKQTDDSTLIKNITQNGENFSLLAYASTGNPRHLLKTIDQAQKLNRNAVNTVIKDYYRSEIWAEHSKLAEKYPGHRALIDWGREFIETDVLPQLKAKNDQWMNDEKRATSFFWIHRDAPAPVKESLRLLQYSGVLMEHTEGIKVTRSQIGTRYLVNLGCLFSEESTPTATAFSIAKNLSPWKPPEYGSSQNIYEVLTKEVSNYKEADMTEALSRQLESPITVLDLTQWEVETAHSVGLRTIGDLLRAPESVLLSAHYVGEKRVQRFRNVAMAAVFEYLSG